MKRRAAALLCCLLLVVQISALPAQAARTVYFTAINDNVLSLTDEGMPFWNGGYLYVDSSIFTMADNTAGKLLGIYRSLNTAKQLLVLSADGRSLIFDLANGTARDDDGINYYPATTIQRNGKVFIPVTTVAYFFNLRYSSTRVDGSYHGYLVRICNDKAGISDDKAFADAASYRLETRYTDYLKSLEPEKDPDTTPSGNDEADEPAAAGKTVYLCFEASDPVVTEALLDALDVYSGQAAFYCTLSFLEEQGDLLRRMTASGHGIGLIADGADSVPVAEQLEAGNLALERATCGKTRLAWLENASNRQQSEAESAGYCCLEPDLDRAAYSLKSSANAATLLQRVTNRRGNVLVWLGSSADGTGLRAFLSAARQADDRCLALTETT